jgi:hypothetical protein
VRVAQQPCDIFSWGGVSHWRGGTERELATRTKVMLRKRRNDEHEVRMEASIASERAPSTKMRRRMSSCGSEGGGQHCATLEAEVSHRVHRLGPYVWI